MIAVGREAPDFALKDQDGKELRLSGLQGKKVLLSFHPLAWTGICAEQMKSLEANHSRFQVLNTVALGVSVDSVPTKKAWATDLGLEKTSLLSDFWPHGEVARMYGVFREQDGFSERANVAVDEQRKIVFAKVYPFSELPDIEEVLRALL